MNLLSIIVKKDDLVFDILASGNFDRSNLLATYDADDIFTLVDDQRQVADQIWMERKFQADLNKIIMYNGILFKLNSLNYTTSSNTLDVSLGQCSYKDYVATRTGMIIDHSGRPVYANPLAICSAVITADRKILVGKRVGVDGSLNKYHVVGGFIELARDDFDIAPCPFKAMKREIYEEVGIEISLDQIACLGVIYDNVAPHPEMCFVSQTGMIYDDIVKLNPQDSEVNSWEYINENPGDLAEFLIEHEESTAIPGLANLLLFARDRFGRDFDRNLLAKYGIE